MKRCLNPLRRDLNLSGAGYDAQRKCCGRTNLLRSPVVRTRQYASVSASTLQFGQPVYETHPHLLKAGESMTAGDIPSKDNLAEVFIVTPGITALEYSHRRAKVASRLPEGGIAIVAASDLKFRSGAVFYDFHQDSNFFYLTGLKNPSQRRFDHC